MKASRDKQLYNDFTVDIESWREYGNAIFTRTFSLVPHSPFSLTLEARKASSEVECDH